MNRPPDEDQTGGDQTGGDQTGGAGIDLVVEGEAGPVVLFLPGSYSTATAWRGVWRAMPRGTRLAATSLCGYGGTAETRTPDDTDMAHQIAVVAAAARRLGGPVHLVGHSFGGTVALAAALSEAIAVASLVLFEANPFALLEDGPHAPLHAEAQGLAAAFDAALARGAPDAPALIIDYWGGDGTFAAMPDPVRDYCRSSAPVNAQDWKTDFGFRPAPDRLAALRMPVTLARGALANPAMVAMTDALAGLLCHARQAAVPDAGHFLISTHAEACAALVADHLAGAARDLTG